MPSRLGFVLATVESDMGVGLAAIIVLGVGLQLIANALRLPAILLLLLGGVLAGPASGLVEPDELLGDLLYPAVSLAVGVILFEGGLGLRFTELERHGRGPILRLITVGVLATWLIGGLGAFLIVGLDGGSAVLLGSILVVTGPTVIIPLVRFARPREPVNGILRVLTTAGTGTFGGLVGAGILIFLFSRHWVPDNLHNPFTLSVAVAAFAGANVVRPEAGLFAATVMGITLANQRWAPVGHIREFEENLGALVLGGLFIVLGASIDLDAVVEYLPRAVMLSIVLVAVARPAAVYLSTVGSELRFAERAYLMCLSPRGIVAASVSALFALELEEAGEPVEALAPVTFVVIVVTVVFSAVASVVGAKRFQVARPPPWGLGFIGGPPWAIDLAAWLADHDIPTLVISTDPSEVEAASACGVLTYAGALDSEDFLLALESVGVSSVIATARFEEFNTLGIHRAVTTVGRANAYYLPRSEEDFDAPESAHAAVVARRPFGKDCTQAMLDEATENGGRIVPLTAESYDHDAVEGAIALVAIDPDGHLVITGNAGAPAPRTTQLYLCPDRVRVSDADQGNGGSSTP